MPTPGKISEQLEQWRDQSRQEGVSHPANLPFFLPGRGKKRSPVLLVHGFCASPWEMLHPARRLAREGHDCLAVRLAGHGTTPEDLADRSWREWLDTVCRGVELLATGGRSVAAVGSSTGALLVLMAATRTPLQRLVLLSPYLRLRHYLAPLAGWLKYLKAFQQQPKPEDLAPYFYDRRPLAGVEQINLLRNELQKQLAAIETPTLILCAEGDQTVDPQSAEEIFNRLAGREKHFFRYGPDVPHVLTIDENPQLEDTLKRISDFLVGG